MPSDGPNGYMMALLFQGPAETQVPFNAFATPQFNSVAAVF